MLAGRSVVTQAAKDFDFDALLMDAANKFEKADNKPVSHELIVSRAVAAIWGFMFELCWT